MAQRISKVDTVTPRVAYGKGAIWFGLPFVAVGVFIALIGFGVLDVDVHANAPLWVGGCVGVAFALAGLIVIAHGIRGERNRRRPRGPEPWFADYPWDAAGVEDRPVARCLSSLLATTFLAIFLVPFNWWAFVSNEGRWPVRAIVCLFDLFLVLAAGTTLYRFVQLARYGRSRLRFLTFPFHPGGALRVAFSPHRFARTTCTLRFVEERLETTGSGKQRQTRQVSYEHYRDVQVREAGILEPELEVEFALPDRPEWTNAISGRPPRYWELLVEADVVGVDFRTTFLLPVYAPAQSPARATPSAAPTA